MKIAKNFDDLPIGKLVKVGDSIGVVAGYRYWDEYQKNCKAAIIHFNSGNVVFYYDMDLLYDSLELLEAK